MARNSKPEPTKCYECGKIISTIKKTEDKTSLSIGFNWTITPTEEWGADRKIYTGVEKQMSWGVRKEYLVHHVCRECMTIEDIKESSFYPEVKERKIKYVKERNK